MLEGQPANERYRLLRRIGAGGMGVVYEAEDRERGQMVALKTLARPDVEQVYQLKREFRVLADLSHPNLVALYDLVVDGDTCFFTMELLDGADFLTHLWRRAQRDDELALALTGILDPAARPALAVGSKPANDVVALGSNSAHADDPGTGDAAAAEVAPLLPTPCDLDRLRAALPQLARGLHALHCAGKIHRDVKPSNIRVTSGGRVVLLDFGLVAELERGGGDSQGGIAGTVAYMAPEQCTGDAPLTAATDWYALGAVLFQALTGRAPFTGPQARVLLDKQIHTAPAPSELVTGVPPDLDELCRELLMREPGSRPVGRTLLRRLGLLDDDTGVLHVPSVSREQGFAGRDAELASLEAARATLIQRRPAVVVVRAPSGMGKTALVNRFLERIRAADGTLLALRGRCFEREDVPYKAIDGLIDELSAWLLELPAAEAQTLLPTDACLLPTLFPVLGRVRAIADAPRTRQVADPQELRTRAFAALRDALRRLADRCPLVLFLDDMQWVDRDTTALLADLMRAPDPPPLMLVMTTRDADSAPVVALARRMDAEVRVIDLGPLDEQVALALAVAQLGEGSEVNARRLVSEAAGSPFFLMELTRYSQGRPLEQFAGKGLDAMLAERIDGLGEAARVLAEVVSVAGEPMARRVIALATALPAPELSRQLSLLRAQRVVRVSGSRADDTVEPYHDRVRETLLAALPDDRRARHHRALATALAGQGAAEQLARHWHGAGERDRAAEHARRAGDEARAKLDFDRAARCYAIALDGSGLSDDERRGLHGQLAESLADAGRPREAADQFLAAAAGSDERTGLELRRRASASLLQSGYIEEGLELTRAVLAAVGMRLPRTPLRALVRWLLRRAWLRLRGLGYRPRSLAEISQAELTRVDVCESVSFGLAMVDTFRSADFASRFLAAALRLGEPWRVSRALALEADMLASLAQGKRALALLARLETLTAELDTPFADSQLLATRGMIDLFLHNRFRSSIDCFTEAITVYRAGEGRAGFEIDTISMFCCFSLYYMGEVGELARRVPAMAEAAARSGNRYIAVTLRCAFPTAWLARLSPTAIEDEMLSALRSWSSPTGSYQLQHLFALCSRIDLALYRGAPEEATPLIAADWKAMRRSMIDRPPLQSVLLHGTLARHAIACAVAAAPGSDRRRAALAELHRIARRFRKARLPFMRAAASMHDGAIAEVEGRTDDAVAAYRAAIPTLEAHDAFVFAHAVRDRLGRVLGGDEGAALRARTRTWLAAEGVREPEPMLAMLLPGPG